MSDIPKLDLEAADLARLIDAVLGNGTKNAANEETADIVFSDSHRSYSGRSADQDKLGDGALNQSHQRESANGDSVRALREHLASVSAQREQLLEALEAANRKAAIGGLNTKLKELTIHIESQLVRYAALIHLTKGTPLDTLDISSLYGLESKQQAHQLVEKIRKAWREG